MEALNNFLNSFRFASPFLALGLALVFILFLYFISRKKKTESHSHLEFLGRERILRRVWQKLFFVLPFLAFVSILIAVADPQIIEETEKPLMARDIVIVLDASGSMMMGFDPEDRLPNFEKTRLGVAEKTLREFIKMREGDRMAIIIYDDPKGYIARGFTDDQKQLLSVFNQEEIEGVYEYLTDPFSRYAIHRGTNTPMALEIVQEYFTKESEAEEKLVVLVTDLDDDHYGVAAALEKTREKGMKVYVIGIVKGKTQQRVERLRKLFKDEGLRFFYIEDREGLLSAFRAIDRMEKSVVEINTVVALNSTSWIFIVSALVLIVIFVILSEKYKKVP